MFTGPVGPVEVFFYWSEAVFGNFYWPGAIGLPLASSPDVGVLMFIPYIVNRKNINKRVYIHILGQVLSQQGVWVSFGLPGS